MKQRWLSLSAFLLLALLLTACGAGGIRSDGGSATTTPIPGSSVTPAPPTSMPTDTPVDEPPPTPRPPVPTPDPSRPVTFDVIHAFVEAAGSTYDPPPDVSWAIKQTVSGWEGWVVDLDRSQDPGNTIKIVITMNDPYAPLPAPASTVPITQRGQQERSGLAYVFVRNLTADTKIPLQVGQKIRFGGTIDQIDTGMNFGVWLANAGVTPLADPVGVRPVPAAWEGLRVSLERTRCFGVCPAYRVTVYGNGLLVWEGDWFVQTPGVYMSIVSEDQIRQLVAAVQASDYFNWKDRYDEQSITDMPSALTAITLGGKSHSIYHYFGDQNAPAALKTLEDQIDTILGTEQWVGALGNL